jgi:signal transduction histidine kinase
MPREDSRSRLALHRINQRLEDEARKFVRAVHDESGQMLAALHMALRQIAHRLSPEDLELVEDARSLLLRTEQHVRRLSRELRPTALDDLGLAAALQLLGDGVSLRSDFTIAVDAEIEDRLPPGVELALFRVVQESLENVVEHAHASRVEVSLSQLPHGIRCSVRDDGIGFDVHEVLEHAEEIGLGLWGIRERIEPLGGTLEITSGPYAGTEVVVQIPLEDFGLTPHAGATNGRAPLSVRRRLGRRG